MKNEGTFRNITNFIPLVVFTLLAVCVLAVLLTGAGIYNRLTDQGQVQYDRRTLSRYLTTRIRQADAAGQLSLGEFGEGDAILLREELDIEVYLTRIYCHGGYLRELFTPENGSFSPEDGEKLLPAQDLQVIRQGSLLLLELTLSDGSRRELTLYLRSEGGILP